MPVGMWVDAHRGVGGVDALAAGAGGAVDVHAQLGLVDLDVVGLLDDRQHLDAREGGLAAALVVEGRDAHQAVGALLDGERAVGVRRLDGEGGRLDAGLFRVRGLVDLGLVAVPLGPAQVHALQLLGEVGGVDAAGLGADVDQRLAGVVLAGEERADLHLVQRLADGGQLGLGLGAGVRVVLVLGELEEHPRSSMRPRSASALRSSAWRWESLLVIFCAALRVVPQGRRRRLLLEHGDVCPQLVEVQDGLDRPHGRGEGLQLFGYIDDCHGSSVTAAERTVPRLLEPRPPGHGCRATGDRARGGAGCLDSRRPGRVAPASSPVRGEPGRRPPSAAASDAPRPPPA